MNIFKDINPHKRSVKIWLITSTIMVFLMIIVGGLTRITDSGLSMVDWRPIMGILPPLNSQSWIAAFNAYKLSPEFKIINYSITLEEFKYIYWWEWSHRFLARILGIIFILPLIFFITKKIFSKKTIFILSFVLVLGLIQALVGWWMVKSGLTDKPHVSSYRLSFHLGIALIIFCILFWLSLNVILNVKEKNKFSPIIYIFYHFNFTLVFLTIISGTFMAGSDAGNAFNTFPLMGDKFIPDDYFLAEYGYFNIFENIVAINFNHRWLGTFTFIFIVIFYSYLLLSNKISVDKFSISLVTIFIISQFILGILTLIHNVPIIYASMHQTNSILLLASMLYSYHRHLFKKEIYE